MYARIENQTKQFSQHAELIKKMTVLLMVRKKSRRPQRGGNIIAGDLQLDFGCWCLAFY